MHRYEGTWESDSKCGYGLFSYLKGNHRSVSGSWIADVMLLQFLFQTTFYVVPQYFTLQFVAGVERMGVRDMQEW
jgi:hypothetical protein